MGTKSLPAEKENGNATHNHSVFGPSGDNGFDQTPKKSSIYGTCAHFSSTNHNEKSPITRMIKQPKTVANQKSNQKRLLFFANCGILIVEVI